MKRRNGFTLIELLAIIVILAIIAVITVPLILGIIDNAQKNASIDSAYGYKKAIDQYYVSKMVADSNYQVIDDEYEISIYKSDGLTVNGEEPKDGWVKVVKGTVARITEYGAFVKLNDYIDGLLHISQISKDKVKKVEDVLKVGDEVEAKVIDFNEKEKRIALSMKALLPEEEVDEKDNAEVVDVDINAYIESMKDEETNENTEV